MYVCPPEVINGVWTVTIVNYPESRSTEDYTFGSEHGAYEFYHANKERLTRDRATDE